MKTLLLAAALTLAAPGALAQAVPDWAKPLSPPSSGASAMSAPPGLPGGSSAPTQEVPIDGGLGLLALAGGALAARRLRS